MSFPRLSTDLEVARSAGLAGHGAPAILLSLPPQHGDCRCASPGLAFVWGAGLELTSSGLVALDQPSVSLAPLPISLLLISD